MSDEVQDTEDNTVDLLVRFIAAQEKLMPDGTVDSDYVVWRSDDGITLSLANIRALTALAARKDTKFIENVDRVIDTYNERLRNQIGIINRLMFRFQNIRTIMAGGGSPNGKLIEIGKELP